MRGVHLQYKCVWLKLNLLDGKEDSAGSEDDDEDGEDSGASNHKLDAVYFVITLAVGFTSTVL